MLHKVQAVRAVAATPDGKCVVAVSGDELLIDNLVLNQA